MLFFLFPISIFISLGKLRLELLALAGRHFVHQRIRHADGKDSFVIFVALPPTRLSRMTMLARRKAFSPIEQLVSLCPWEPRKQARAA